jgi:hypothetical protein
MKYIDVSEFERTLNYLDKINRLDSKEIILTDGRGHPLPNIDFSFKLRKESNVEFILDVLNLNTPDILVK